MRARWKLNWNPQRMSPATDGNRSNETRSEVGKKNAYQIVKFIPKTRVQNEVTHTDHNEAHIIHRAPGSCFWGGSGSRCNISCEKNNNSIHGWLMHSAVGSIHRYWMSSESANCWIWNLRQTDALYWDVRFSNSEMEKEYRSAAKPITSTRTYVTSQRR
jgi:hypothetical protein